MTVRGANYPRKPNDFYATPPETTRALLDLVRFRRRICDPACGNSAILKICMEYGHEVGGNDIDNGFNFLNDRFDWPGSDIVTNPPFGIGGRTAVQFIERALEVADGRIAMLLPVDFDSGKTRRHVFADCPPFGIKIVLLNRIRWFNGQAGSINHAWFVWDKKWSGPPILHYAEQDYPLKLLA